MLDFTLETVESINNVMLLSSHGDERNTSTEFLNDMKSLRIINHRLLKVEVTIMLFRNIDPTLSNSTRLQVNELGKMLQVIF